MSRIKDALDRVIDPEKKSANIKFTSRKIFFSPRSKALFFILGFLLSLSLAAGGWILQNQVRLLKKKEKRLAHEMRRLKQKTIAADCLGGIPAPSKLIGLPFADDLGIVVDVKTVDVRNVTAPHNPSLIQTASGYDLFFRYDKMSKEAKHLPYFSHIGVVSLTPDFSQEAAEFQKIELPTGYSEDPRVLWMGDQLYLIFNMLDPGNTQARFICLANINPNNYKVNYTTPLDMNLVLVEKNWPPFVFVEENQKPALFFEYQISPHKILSLPNPRENELLNIALPRNSSYISLSHIWESKWGRMRGGTPALKIGDEYLAFFHSGFTEKNGMWWYVMGAYTFQAEYPFSLTKISKHPILFRNIFETPIIHTADHNKRVIYPAGFVIEEKDGKELIHLACGENDCAIKIVTLDKKALIENMNRIEQ